MKLFVDDRRTPPEKGFECAVDYEGAVFLIRYMDFEFATLDYDLGDGHTGLDILKFMHENIKYPRHLNIHSDHPEGRVLMRDFAKENFPEDVRITMNSVD
ncbi:MAG: cyclic-phosphate processing receiver domain-containing protein [Oscillospiraceae bacterium]